MLVIRSEQMAALDRYAAAQFEDRVAAHLRARWPQSCAEMGDAALRERVAIGVERAAGYGLVAELDVCRYVELMFVLSPDFDTDARFPWAGEVLRQPELAPCTRIDRLEVLARRCPEARAPEAQGGAAR